MSTASCYLRGVKNGLPVALGYLSVSFGFGILCIAGGMPLSVALLISMTNLTSAGQVAGVGVMMAGGGLGEMALTQLVINIRYALMSLTLSQNLHPSFTLPHRLLASFGITDEIFALASAEREPLRPAYLYGLITLPYFGWAGGTLLGATLGVVLPVALRDALGIALYGMFLAIFLPPAKKSRGVLLCVLLSAGLSVAVSVIPFLDFLSSGFSVVLCALAGAAVAAALFPAPSEEEKDDGVREEASA